VEDYVVPILPVMDLRISMGDAPDPVLVETDLHLRLVVTNAGPSMATGVSVRDTLPPTATFFSASASQGSCSNQGSIVTCDLGALASGAAALIDIDIIPHRIGLIAHRAEVSGIERDLVATNNIATETSTVVAAFGPYRSTDPIVLPDFGPASIYPSTINVIGVTGTVYQVIVTLQDLSHTFPGDLDILLV